LGSKDAKKTVRPTHQDVLLLIEVAEIDLAVRAIETALEQNPSFPRAHHKLSMIYSRDLKDNARADFHRREAHRVRQLIRPKRRSAQRPQDHAEQAEYLEEPAEIISDVRREELRGVPADEWIVIVSGLPRAGTYMMMQMLNARGVPICTDQVREPDANNPNGYLEFEKVKGLAKDAKWVADSQGQALKVVAQLVNYLPPHLHYKFIFMDRDLEEVIQSQQTMLGQLSSEPARADGNLRTVFRKQLGLAKQRVLEDPNAEMITVAHRDTIERPAVVARRVAEFLELPNPDLLAMAQVVDHCLYRSRPTGAVHHRQSAAIPRKPLCHRLRSSIVVELHPP
jgi:hypothetical protein